MILSNTAIFAALDEGRLVIRPQPSPRVPTENPLVDCPYQTTAVDLRLGDEIVWFNDGLPITIDLRRGRFADLFGPNSRRQPITQEQSYTLAPGKLVLAKTLEHVEFPIFEDRPCLAARVEGRSSVARCGVLVHFTAPTVHAGFSGHLTLEMINLGAYPISLYAGMYICQLIIEEVQGIPRRNDSQFQGQTRPGGAKD